MLGVKVDNRLSYKDQIDKVAGTLSKGIGLLRNINDYLQYHIRKPFCNHIRTICVTVWG